MEQKSVGSQHFFVPKKMDSKIFWNKKVLAELVVSSQNEIKSKKNFPKSFLKSKKNLCELSRANNYLLHLLFLGVNIDMISHLIFFWVLIVTFNSHFLELLKVFVRNKSYQEGRLIQHGLPAPSSMRNEIILVFVV